MKIFKTIVSYVTIFGIILLYTFFLDGESGIIMIAFFIAVPLISLTLTIIASIGISAELICNDNLLKKNADTYFTMKIRKKSFFPAPFISVITSASLHFDTDDENIIKVSMPVKKEISFQRKCHTRFCGNAYFSIENAFISDYLNIFTFRLRNASQVHHINIIPDVHELNSAGTAFRKVSDMVRIDEDEDETESSSLFGMSSFPGYEHREYVPGDPIKRINWKLSSKKNVFMVRLDENTPSVRPCIVLDLSRCSEESEESIALRERITEGCLSFMDFCVKQGIECSFSYCENGEWRTQVIPSSDYVADMAVKVSMLGDSSVKSHLPEEAFLKSKNSGVFVTFVQSLCDEIEEDISNASQSGASVFAVTADLNSLGYENVWYIDDNLEIKESGKEVS